MNAKCTKKLCKIRRVLNQNLTGSILATQYISN